MGLTNFDFKMGQKPVTKPKFEVNTVQISEDEFNEMVRTYPPRQWLQADYLNGFVTTSNLRYDQVTKFIPEYTPLQLQNCINAFRGTFKRIKLTSTEIILTRSNHTVPSRLKPLVSISDTQIRIPNHNVKYIKFVQEEYDFTSTRMTFKPLPIGKNLRFNLCRLFGIYFSYVDKSRLYGEVYGADEIVMKYIPIHLWSNFTYFEPCLSVKKCAALTNYLAKDIAKYRPPS